MARGTVFRKGGRWALSIELPPDTDGRRRRTYDTFDTKREAEKARTKYLADLDAGRNPVPENVLFSDYADAWLAGREKLRPTTRRRYRGLLDQWVNPVLGGMYVRAIRPDHVRAVLTKMRDAGQAGASRQQARALMGAVLGQAVKDEVRETNPVRAVERPAAASKARDGLLTPDDVTAILEQARGTIWHLPVLLAAWTGARRSEVLGLRWSDIDFATGEVRISRSRQRVAGETIVGDPKTERGRRTVQLPADVLAEVAMLRDAQLVRTIDGWCCTGPLGAPLSPDGLSHAFKRFCGAVGKGDACLHHLRHALATDLIEGGLDPAATSLILGHSTPAFTQAQYVHPERWAAERASEVLAKRRAPASARPSPNLSASNGFSLPLKAVDGEA